MAGTTKQNCGIGGASCVNCKSQRCVSQICQ
jgi:hypothetical protein